MGLGLQVGFTFDSKEWDELLKQMRDGVEKARTKIPEVAHALLEQLRSVTPQQYSDGMRKAWTLRKIPVAQGVTGAVLTNNHPAVIFHEYGTSGGKTVVAKKVFAWDDAGGTHFIKSFVTKAMKPKAFVRNTLRSFYRKHPEYKGIIQVALVGNSKYGGGTVVFSGETFV